MFRPLSIFIRHLQSEKSAKRVLRNFNEWKPQQQTLPAYLQKNKKLLLIRLDDIGDYILFRNTLNTYKNAPRWKDHELILLGNIAYKSLFDLLDANAVDKTIWVDKNEYFDKASIRNELWTQLRNEGFETVICPSRTRQLLLDDLCVLACGATKNIGSENNSRHSSWNILSDSFYTELFHPKNHFEHEFYFNQHFAEWCCGPYQKLKRPEILLKDKNISVDNYILCFIGASTNSKKWPAKRWIDFILLFQQYSKLKIIIAGGPNDTAMANDILSGFPPANKTVENITGKISLAEILSYIDNAAAIITNDTMAAHIAAAYSTPAVIIANGNNHYRFTDYEKAAMQNISAIYPAVFRKKLKENIPVSLHHTAVTKDIASITAEEVFNLVENIIVNKAPDKTL
jgi:ADP-heptose:LPS heptosyltransferase